MDDKPSLRRYYTSMPDTQETILNALLPLIPFDGWTQYSLTQAAKKANIDTSALKIAFPDGIQNVREYFSAYSDSALQAQFADGSLLNLRMPERIETLVLARLAYWQKDREAVRRLFATNALPWNLTNGLASVSCTVDLIWRLAGDESIDFNWYTKRATLAAVYSSTVLFWLNDRSESTADTHAFLTRRLQNVADFGKWKKTRFG